MTADDDRLDPDLAERFRRLDDVSVPDTWDRDSDPLATGPAGPGTRAWWAVAAAVLVAALVAGIALTRGGDGEVVVGPSGTGTSPAPGGMNAPPTVEPVEPPVTTAPAPADAIAEPSSGFPGDTVAITPAGVVDRICTDIVIVGTAGGSTELGLLTAGGQWLPYTDDVPVTWPACLPPPSDASLAVTLPPLELGTYRFCLDSAMTAAACALITVGAESPPALPHLLPALPGDATAEPASAEPGDRIVLTPTGPVQRQCTDLVSVYDAATRYVGHIGARFSPSPGEGDTVPACVGDVSAEPIEVFVPPLPAGMYSFCVSDQLTPEGCANVEVLPSPLLATASSSEVITGDTIVITPAGVVPRICSDIVVVRDLARVVPLVQTYPDGTSEPPRPGGGWERPECLPEPSAAPLMLVVPDIDTGAYAFCLSDDVDGAGCALVTVVGRRVPDPSVPPDMTLPAPETTAPPNDEAMAAYRNQQALFRAGDFPLDPASDSSCDECSAGAVVGVQRYAVVDRVDQPDGLIGPVATVLYGDVYAVDGVEPAVALVLDGSPEGNPRDWYLMVLENGPRVFADPADETELQAAWCGVSARFPELADFLDCPPA